MTETKYKNFLDSTDLPSSFLSSSSSRKYPFVSLIRLASLCICLSLYFVSPFLPIRSLLVCPVGPALAHPPFPCSCPYASPTMHMFSSFPF